MSATKDLPHLQGAGPTTSMNDPIPDRIPLPYGHGSVTSGNDKHWEANPSFLLEWGSTAGAPLT